MAEALTNAEVAWHWYAGDINGRAASRSTEGKV